MQNGNISFALVDEMFGVTCTMDSSFLISNQPMISGLKKDKSFHLRAKCDGMLSDFVLTQSIHMSK